MKKGDGAAFIEHFCARCGNPIKRRIYNSINNGKGGLESVASYNRRRYCSLSCGSYHDRSNIKDKKCKNCKKTKPINEFEVWKGTAKSGIRLEIPLNVCRECKRLEEVIWRWKTGRSGSMLTNPECGVYIWEHSKRIILELYPGVYEMPQLNSGYNFICTNDKKLAVRSGRILSGRAAPTWTFHTERTTADYIICFAYADTIIPINLLHMWAIPRHVFRGRKRITITGSHRGLAKWDRFELGITDPDEDARQ